MAMQDPKVTILCVEDDLFVRDQLQQDLSDRGFKVLVASASDEAEQLIYEHKPDFVLCDVMMPGRNGFELLTDLRIHGKLPKGTAFMFLTALNAREPQLEGLRAGAVDYLTKPVDFDLLILKIENTLAYGAQKEMAAALKGSSGKYSNIRLSPREEQVLALLGAGARTVAIAHELSLSEHTVNQYIKEVYRKLGLANRADAARAAIELGYVTP